MTDKRNNNTERHSDIFPGHALATLTRHATDKRAKQPYIKKKDSMKKE